jgi:hypothetical protein
MMGRNSLVGIATGYGLEDRGVGIRIPVGVKNFLHLVQTGSEIHSTSYAIGTAALFRGIERPGHEAEYSPLTSAEVNKMWNYTSTPLILLHG